MQICPYIKLRSYIHIWTVSLHLEQQYFKYLKCISSWILWTCFWGNTVVWWLGKKKILPVVFQSWDSSCACQLRANWKWNVSGDRMSGKDRSIDNKWQGGWCVEMPLTWRDSSPWLFCFKNIWFLRHGLLHPSPGCCRQTISYFFFINLLSFGKVCILSLAVEQWKKNGIMQFLWTLKLKWLSLVFINLSIAREFCNILIFIVAKCGRPHLVGV